MMRRKAIGAVGWVFLVLGLLLMTWLALKSAPFFADSFFAWIGAVGDGKVFSNPLQLSWSDSSLVTLLIMDGLYLFMVLYALLSRKNKRPGEEYGSASWGNVKALRRKYENREVRVDIL